MRASYLALLVLIMMSISDGFAQTKLSSNDDKTTPKVSKTNPNVSCVEENTPVNQARYDARRAKSLIDKQKKAYPITNNNKDHE